MDICPVLCVSIVFGLIKNVLNVTSSVSASLYLFLSLGLFSKFSAGFFSVVAGINSIKIEWRLP